MLFKASRCEDTDMLKSFAGDFNAKLGGMVGHLSFNKFLVHQEKSSTISSSVLPLQLPNICCSDDVTCKLEVMSQGHCLEYNHDYDNGFSISRICSC